MAREKSEHPRRLPPPRLLSGHRQQLSRVAEQLMLALNRRTSDRSPPSPSTLNAVSDIVEVVIDAATVDSAQQTAAATRENVVPFENTREEGALQKRDAPCHGEPIRSKKNAPVFDSHRTSCSKAPSPSNVAVVDSQSPSFTMPKPKQHVEVLDDDATDDDVIFLPKLSIRLQQARGSQGGGKRPRSKRNGTTARGKHAATSKSSSRSSPVARKQPRRRAQGAVNTLIDGERGANNSRRTADREPSTKAAATTKRTKRTSAVKTTRPAGAGKANRPYGKLKPSKTIAKRSSKSSPIASAGSKSKSATNSRSPSSSKVPNVPPSTKPATKRLEKLASKPQCRSARKTKPSSSDSHPPNPQPKTKANYKTRKEPEEQPHPAPQSAPQSTPQSVEDVEDHRPYYPPTSFPEKEEANYPHSDISSDVDLGIENTACTVCSELGDYAKMVLCDACASGCHVYCMQPSRSSIPLGTWICPSCHTVAKRHQIYISRMVVLREEQRCYDCVKRNIKTYNSKSPVRICADCRLVFHTNCLRRFHGMRNTDLQKKDWTCEVCVEAEEKRKEEETAMLAKQRARLEQKRARAKRPRLSAPYLGGAIPGALSQRAPHRHSKPATFIATSLPPVPVGNSPNLQSPDILTNSQTPRASGEPRAVEKVADQGVEPSTDPRLLSPRSRMDVSVSTEDRVEGNTQRAFRTLQDPLGPIHTAPLHPDRLGRNSQSRTTSIPVPNSADAHTLTVQREASNPVRGITNHINPMSPAPQAEVPLEQRIADELTGTHETRHNVQDWNGNVQNSVNDISRYDEPSLNRRTSVVTSAKSKSKSKAITPDDTIPATLYNSNVSAGVQQERMFNSMVATAPQGGMQNNVYSPTYGYGRWQRPAPQDTDLRQDPTCYQPRDSSRFIQPSQSPSHMPSTSRPPMPDDQIRCRQNLPGLTLGLNGNLRPPVDSSVPLRNRAPEVNVHPSRNRIAPTSSFDPSSAAPHSTPATAPETLGIAGLVRFQNEAPPDIPPQHMNERTEATTAPIRNQRNTLHNHGAARSTDPGRYSLNPNRARHRVTSEPRFPEPQRQPAIGSAPETVQVDSDMTSRFGLNAQRSESCGPDDMGRMLDPTQSKRPVGQSQSSGQAALMRAALTQAANHVGYSQSHAQNGNAVMLAKGYHGTGMNADQMASPKGFPGCRLDRPREQRQQELTSNPSRHISSGGAKSTVSVAEKSTGARVNSAPLSPAPLQKSAQPSNALEEPLSPKVGLLAPSSVMQTREEPEFVESGSLRAWIMLNISPRKRFHGSMFLDMPYRSYFSGAIRVLYDESRSLRVVAFSKFDCETSHNRLKEWWTSNRSHFSLAPEHFPDENSLTTDCLSKGFRLDVL